MMLDCPICASGNIEHKATHPPTMTNDEAQEWLLAQHNAAPGPPDPARFGAAIRAIRAKAIADCGAEKADTGELARTEVVAEMENEGVVRWADPRHRERFLAFLVCPDPSVERIEAGGASPEVAARVAEILASLDTGELARLREALFTLAVAVRTPERPALIQAALDKADAALYAAIRGTEE